MGRKKQLSVIGYRLPLASGCCRIALPWAIAVTLSGFVLRVLVSCVEFLKLGSTLLSHWLDFRFWYMEFGF